MRSTRTIPSTIGAVVGALAAFAVPSLVPARRAEAAVVAEAQPDDPYFPQSTRYPYGGELFPYRVTYHLGRWWLPTDDYVIYEPVDGARAIATAPVVLLLQGYDSDGPEQFDRLIRHLTRTGITVVYPRFLNVYVNGASFEDWVAKTSASYASALRRLDAPGHVHVERDAAGRPEVAFVAHSIGSYVATVVAARARAVGDLPAPLALVFLDPAGWDWKPYLGIDLATQAATLDPTTEVILLSAEDMLVDAEGKIGTNYQYAVRDLVEQLPVTCDHLSAWVVTSDRADEGAPADGGQCLVSDHFGGPQTHHVFDAVDWWGYWLPLAAHLQHAFWGTYGMFTHAGSTYAGTWRDSVDGSYVRDIRPRYPHPQYPVGYGCAGEE